MLNKKKFLTLIKIEGLLLVLILMVFLIPTSYSKYASKGNSSANLSLAFYLLKTNYYTNNILLADIAPRMEPYVYNFDVSNNDGTHRTETNLQYELSIKTTTNLPVEYELYLDEEYDDDGASNILQDSAPVADSDGTYFKTMTTQKKYFYHTHDEIHHYQLVVYFNEEYKDHQYQDIYENVQIIIDSKQLINGN